jgi:cell division protein FtsB
MFGGITATVLGLIFGGGKGTKFTVYLMLAVLLGAGGYSGFKAFQAGKLRREVTTLTEKNTSLTVDNTVLKENNAVLKDQVHQLATANFSNYQSAKALTEERSANVIAVQALAANQKRNLDALDRLNKKVEDMIKDPKNDGEVAPVLREIVREIQKERATR